MGLTHDHWMKKEEHSSQGSDGQSGQCAVLTSAASGQERYAEYAEEAAIENGHRPQGKLNEIGRIGCSAEVVMIRRHEERGEDQDSTEDRRCPPEARGMQRVVRALGPGPNIGDPRRADCADGRVETRHRGCEESGKDQSPDPARQFMPGKERHDLAAVGMRVSGLPAVHKGDASSDGEKEKSQREVDPRGSEQGSPTAGSVASCEETLDHVVVCRVRGESEKEGADQGGAQSVASGDRKKRRELKNLGSGSVLPPGPDFP